MLEKNFKQWQSPIKADISDHRFSKFERRVAAEKLVKKWRKLLNRHQAEIYADWMLNVMSRTLATRLSNPDQMWMFEIIPELIHLPDTIRFRDESGETIEMPGLDAYVEQWQLANEQFIELNRQRVARKAAIRQQVYEDFAKLEAKFGRHPCRELLRLEAESRAAKAKG